MPSSGRNPDVPPRKPARSAPRLQLLLDQYGIRNRFVSLQTADRHPLKPHASMARASGTRALGVGWSYHQRERLRAAGADAVIDDPLAIPAALLALLSATPTCPT
ncbi:hypothetical protein [Sphingomonas guangdongensis]|uniref:hypothetical protein n=1 Tax=Sphingomonas guangdongensis TaxID=1141890 RepID=UPI000BE3A335|nr:hypothetical protein [Sphingomonas guangdongensis]